MAEIGVCSFALNKLILDEQFLIYIIGHAMYKKTKNLQEAMAHYSTLREYLKSDLFEIITIMKIALSIALCAGICLTLASLTMVCLTISTHYELDYGWFTPRLRINNARPVMISCLFDYYHLGHQTPWEKAMDSNFCNVLEWTSWWIWLGNEVFGPKHSLHANVFSHNWRYFVSPDSSPHIHDHPRSVFYVH